MSGRPLQVLSALQTQLDIADTASADHVRFQNKTSGMWNLHVERDGSEATDLEWVCRCRCVPQVFRFMRTLKPFHPRICRRSPFLPVDVIFVTEERPCQRRLGPRNNKIRITVNTETTVWRKHDVAECLLALVLLFLI